MFEHEEHKHLKPIPQQPFDTDDLDHDIVSPSFQVRFDRNKYSVPWHLEGQRATIRGTDDYVRVFVGPKCVASTLAAGIRASTWQTPRRTPEIKTSYVRRTATIGRTRTPPATKPWATP